MTFVCVTHGPSTANGNKRGAKKVSRINRMNVTSISSLITVFLLGMTGPLGHGAAGPITATEVKLTPMNGPVPDFGGSVAISGDTAAVWGDEYGGEVPFNSSVTVFARSGSTWSQQTQVFSPSFVEGFSAVAISGDTMVVGARAPLDSLRSTGLAYVFVRSGTTWTQQARLFPNDTLNGFPSYWSTSVAISGDTIVVGVPLTNQGPIQGVGRAYVFVRSGSTWSQQAELLPSYQVKYGEFGRSVAMDGNIIVIGAP